MQPQRASGYWDQHLAARGIADPTLGVRASSFEAAPLIPKLSKTAGGTKSGGLPADDDQCSDQKNQEPEQNPVPAFKPSHRPQRSEAARF